MKTNTTRASFSFIFIFLFCITNSVLANKIDSLNSDVDVEEFIQRQSKSFEDFHVVPLNKLYRDVKYQQLADSLGVKTWQKVDFDNNGLTDILVYGNWAGIDLLIAILDDGKEFKYHRISSELQSVIYFPILKTIENQLSLINMKGCNYCSGGIKEIISTDTLVFKFGEFVELKFNTSTYNIEKIEYRTTNCYGACPVFELKIKKDRTAKYKAIQYNDKKGNFKTVIDTTNYNQLISILNYLDFPNLKDDYSVSWTDAQSCTLKVTYDNGKVKELSDYGLQGTDALSLLYRKLFALRKNQTWKKYL